MTEINVPLVAYRCWFALLQPWNRAGDEEETIGLRSVGHAIEWPAPQPMQARCMRTGTRPTDVGLRLTTIPEHSAPDAACSCGLYAYDRLETARLYMSTYSDGLRKGLVLGAVLLWGRVMVGDVNADKRLPEPGLRYRAEFGQVLAIRMEDEWSYELSEKFGIPRAAERYLEAFAKEQGEHLEVGA